MYAVTDLVSRPVSVDIGDESEHAFQIDFAHFISYFNNNPQSSRDFNRSQYYIPYIKMTAFNE